MLAVIFAWSARAERRAVDRILAVIDDQLVTQSDLVVYSEVLRRTRKGLLPAEVLFAPGEPEEIQKRVFKEVVLRRLIYPEAVKLNLAEVDPAELERDYRALRDTFASREEFLYFCALLGLSGDGRRDVGKGDDPAAAAEDEAAERLRYILHQYLVCRAYVEKRIGLQVRIHLAAYFEEHRDRYPGGDLDAVRPQVEADLFREKLDAWLADLIARSNVRIVFEPFRDALR